MIQFNLLPDVKIQYIKARKLKRMISVFATVITAVAIGCVLLLLVVNGLQAKHLHDLNNDIKRDSSKLENTPNLNKILTVQSQLQSLPGLHAKKPISSRFFSYVSQLTPSQVSLSSASVDFTTNSMTFSGTADALSSVNTFVDTLKFATYQKQGETAQTPAFSKVVLTTFGRNPKGASYTINLNFDPQIFDGANNVTLTVPNQITTRSETEKPTALFQTDATNTKAGQ